MCLVLQIHEDTDDVDEDEEGRSGRKEGTHLEEDPRVEEEAYGLDKRCISLGPVIAKSALFSTYFFNDLNEDHHGLHKQN